MIEKSLARWSRKVKQNAGNICEMCGQDGAGDHGSLESHHIVALSRNPLLELETDNGVCLCHFCHLCAHGGNFDLEKKYAQYWIFNRNGPKHYEDVRSIQERLNKIAEERKIGSVLILPDRAEYFKQFKIKKT